MGLLFVGCAVAMTLAALAFVLLPLTRRRVHDARAERMRALDAALAAGVIDADEHARKRAALAANPAPANTARGAPLALVVALAVFIPASAALLYRAVGTPQALDPKARAPVAASGDHTSAADMQQAIAALAERLKQEPGDVEGWALLGRAHATLGQAGAAVEAYRHAHELAPDDAAVGVEYAQALALAAPDHRIAGKARELLDAIAAREPTNQRALWLLGISDYQVGRYDAAIARWNALLPLLADNPGVADSVRAQIAEAQARRDGTAPPAAASA
ncbi:MAG: tetratricopeptide repeat protein, partial [Dokdonella sp.]